MTQPLLGQPKGITGLANRRCFDEALAQDVDSFESYNDSDGFPERDQCLREIGRPLQAPSTTIRRPSDLAARFVREEFAVLLPRTGRAQAAYMSERIRAAIYSMVSEHLGNAGNGCVVTASVGYTTASPRPVPPSALQRELDQLVSVADCGLYRAKETDQNYASTIQVAADLIDQPPLDLTT